MARRKNLLTGNKLTFTHVTLVPKLSVNQSIAVLPNLVELICQRRYQIAK